jgi:quinol monooxygenase YgiN
MLVVHVFANVKPDRVEDFKRATIENVSNSIKELGIEQFDLVQQIDDPTKFVLVETYKSSEYLSKHLETVHY